MEERKTYIIPQNYSSFISMGNTIKSRNLIEAVVATYILWQLLSSIPFIFKIKAGVTIIGCIICFIAFLFGYNEESLTSYLAGYIRFKISSGVRRMKIPDGKVDAKFSGEGKLAQSNYEKLVERIKHRFH